MQKNRYPQIIAVLLSNPNRDDACKLLKITKRSLEKILSREDFRQFYQNEQTKILEHVTGYLTNNIGEMSKILFNMATDESIPHQVRLNAIKVVFEYAVKFTETTNILKRIEKLEEENGINEH